MDLSTKRKAGAIALIAAGIGAFLVPFLLHGPALQASNNGGGNTNNNNNNGSGKTPPGTNCTTNCTPPPTGSNPSSCTTDPSNDSGHSNEGKHLAKGHDKQDKDDTSLVAKAHSLMAAMAKHNPQHDATHSTKTDNHTVGTHGPHSNSHDSSDDNDCTDAQGNDDSDDQGDDD